MEDGNEPSAVDLEEDSVPLDSVPLTFSSPERDTNV